MRKLWRTCKLVIGLTLSVIPAIVGCVAYLIDQVCDAIIDALARWAKA